LTVLAIIREEGVREERTGQPQGGAGKEERTRRVARATARRSGQGELIGQLQGGAGKASCQGNREEERARRATRATARRNRQEERARRAARATARDCPYMLRDVRGWADKAAQIRRRREASMRSEVRARLPGRYQVAHI